MYNGGCLPVDDFGMDVVESVWFERPLIQYGRNLCPVTQFIVKQTGLCCWRLDRVA